GTVGSYFWKQRQGSPSDRQDHSRRQHYPSPLGEPRGPAPTLVRSLFLIFARRPLYHSRCCCDVGGRGGARCLAVIYVGTQIDVTVIGFERYVSIPLGRTWPLSSPRSAFRRESVEFRIPVRFTARRSKRDFTKRARSSALIHIRRQGLGGLSRPLSENVV